MDDEEVKDSETINKDLEKATEEEVTNIEKSIKDLKKEIENESNTLESLKAVIEKLSEASQTLATKIYEDAAKESGQQPSQDDDNDVVDGEVVEEDE